MNSNVSQKYINVQRSAYLLRHAHAPFHQVQVKDVCSTVLLMDWKEPQPLLKCSSCGLHFGRGWGHEGGVCLRIPGEALRYPPSNNRNLT